MTITTLDQNLYHAFLGMPETSLTRFFAYFTELGGVPVMGLLALLTCYYLWRKRLFSYLATFVVAFFGSTATTYLLKHLVTRPRPWASLIFETGFSFPSGHATAATVFFGFSGFVLAQQLFPRHKTITQICSAALVLLIGFSRLYLGVHFFTDVLAGYLVGVLWLLFARWICGVRHTHVATK